MKKYLMMALIALAIAGCSKSETETEVPLPTMSDQEIWDTFTGTRWHEDVNYITGYTFSASKHDTNSIGYKGKIVEKAYYYYDYYIRMVNDAWYVADHAIHVVRMTIRRGQTVDDYFYPEDYYEEWMTITPHSIKGDTITVTKVRHNIRGMSFDNTDKPETIKLIKGAKPDYDPSGKIE